MVKDKEFLGVIKHFPETAITGCSMRIAIRKISGKFSESTSDAVLL